MSDEEKDKEFSFDAMSKSLEGKLSRPADNARATGIVEELTHSDVIRATQDSPTSLVLFYRHDCPYCERLMPLLDELAEEYKSKVAFSKLNIDIIEEPRKEFEILGVPLVIAFKRGLPVGRIEGLRSIDDYDSWIESIHKGLRPMGFDNGPVTRIK